MRILVTGAGGFVGRWLTRELELAGHEVIAPRGRAALDVTDAEAVAATIRSAAPDAVAHLAAVSFGPDARSDPALALRTTVGGTVHVLEGVRHRSPSPAVLVSGSSEVYGRPRPEELPLTEESPLRPSSPYALSKAAQEGVALAYAARHGLRLAVTRSFNHAGPGQRGVFVLPALAERLRAVARGEATDVATGNLDVRRDFTDVRDVVRAYRLLLERLVDGHIASGGAVLNVASGRSVAIRELLAELCRVAGIEPVIRSDPALVRHDDPPDISGDPGALVRLTGWRPERPIESTVREIWEETPSGAGARGRAC